MRTMGWVVPLVALLAASGCSGGLSSSGHVRTPPSPSPEVVVPVDLAVTQALDKVEPSAGELALPHLSAGDLLALKARQIGTVCTGTAALAQLPEPSPHDLPRLLAYATTYMAVLADVSLAAKVEDAVSPPDNRRKVAPPMPVQEAIVQEIAAMHAFKQRILAGSAAVADKSLPRRLLPDWLDRAWVDLVNDYTAPDRVLVSWAARHCVG